MLASDLNINAGATFSFPELDTWFSTAVALLNDDFIALALGSADCHVGFPHAVFYAGRPDAVFVANLHSAGGRGKNR
jgi:hypothetical protein